MLDKHWLWNVPDNARGQVTTYINVWHRVAHVRMECTADNFLEGREKKDIKY